MSDHPQGAQKEHELHMGGVAYKMAHTKITSPTEHGGTKYQIFVIKTSSKNVHPPFRGSTNIFLPALKTKFKHFTQIKPQTP